MSSRFEFATATRILFGPGVVREAGSIARSFGQLALVVTGGHPERAEFLISLLGQSGVSASTFSVQGEPKVGTIREGVSRGKEHGCDVVIGIGGGSALDAGKAIAAMLTNEGELLDYLEVIGKGKPLTKRPLPYIAIPTTAGTGTEVTRNAVLGAPEHRVKVSLRSPDMLPRVALVDPELTYDLPAGITASTGLDALTQLIEPFVCSRSNPLTDSFCRDGMTRIARSFVRAVENGRDIAARADMSLASLYGGLALANAGLGAVHGLAGPFGGMFPAPHGAICAALLAPVIGANAKALLAREPSHPALVRYEEAARLLTRNPQAGVEQLGDWVSQLVSGVHIPKLSSYGFGMSECALLVQKAMQSSSMKANPIALTASELTAAVEQAV